jgi:hypothetical protein
MPEDGVLRGSVYQVDPQGRQVAYAVAGLPRHGTLTFDVGTGDFTYRPAPDWSGADTFYYTASAQGLVSAPTAVRITVVQVDDAPRVQAISGAPQGTFSDVVLLLQLPEDGTATGQVAAWDPEGAPMTYRVVEPPAHGALDLDAATGQFTYRPAPDFSGTDLFRFTGSDGLQTSAAAAVVLEVAPVNDAPVAASQALQLLEDEAVSGTLAATDVDGPAATFAVATPPAHGTVVLDPATGAFTYRPEPDWSGADAFTFTASDGIDLSAPATVRLEVLPVNDAPVAQGGALEIEEDGLAAGQVVATDVDGPALAFQVVLAPLHGTLLLDPATGSFTYAPERDWSGDDAFQVVAWDGEAASAPATISLRVHPVNDPPVAQDQVLATDEDVPVAGQLQATDVDGPTLGYIPISMPAHGTLALDAATGAFLYRPAPDWSGTDGFAFVATDGQAVSAVATVSLQVRPVNDAPVAADLDLTLDEDGTALGQVPGSDVDGPALGFATARPPLHGALLLDPGTGAFTYAPERDWNGTDSFQVAVSDGLLQAISTVTLHVLPVNDPPVAQAQALATDEDVPLTGRVTATDPDGPALSFAVAVPPAHGALALDPATGAFSYRPDRDWNGTDGFDFTASDGLASSAPARVSIAVTPVNDAPVAEALAFQVDEDTTFRGALPARDVDGDTLTWTLATVPAHGVVDLDSTTGSFTYRPAPDYNGPDRFTFTAADGLLASAPAEVTVTVRPVNDAPVAEDQALSVDEDGYFAGLLRATDIDSPVITFAITSGPSHGSVDLDSGTGAFVYRPTPYYTGADDFSFVAADGQSTSSAARIAISVVPLPASPVIAAPAFTVVGRESYLASAQADEGTEVHWTITGGRLGSQTIARAVTFSPIQPPQLVLSAVAVDGTGRRSRPASRPVTVAAAPAVPLRKAVAVTTGVAGPLDLNLPGAPGGASLSVSITNLSGDAVRFPQIHAEGEQLPYEMADIRAALSGASADRELAEAAWRYVRDRFFHYCSGASPDPDPEADRHSLFASGSMLTFGFGCCDQTSDYLASVWTQLGFQARIAAMPFHTVAEVYYDGAWHMYDPDHRTYYFTRDRIAVASVEQVLADPELVTLSADTMGRDPVDWPATRMAQYYADTRSLHYYAPRAAGQSWELALQPGETFTLNQRNQAGAAVRFASFGDSFSPASVTSGSHQLLLDAGGQALALAERVTGVVKVVPPDGQPILEQETVADGTLVYRRTSPYVLLGARVLARVVAAKGSLAARFSVDGSSWSEAVALAPTRSYAGYTHAADLTALARPRHSYFLMLEFQGGVQVQALELKSDVQANRYHFPLLRAGPATRVLYKDASPPGQSRLLLATAEAATVDAQITGLELWRNVTPLAATPVYVETPELLASPARSGPAEEALEYVLRLDTPAPVRLVQVSFLPQEPTGTRVNWSLETRAAPEQPWIEHASGVQDVTDRLEIDALATTQELRLKARAAAPLRIVQVAAFRER